MTGSARIGASKSSTSSGTPTARIELLLLTQEIVGEKASVEIQVETATKMREAAVELVRTMSALRG